jgi:hypothetical protein
MSALRHGVDRLALYFGARRPTPSPSRRDSAARRRRREIFDLVYIVVLHALALWGLLGLLGLERS